MPQSDESSAASDGGTLEISFSSLLGFSLLLGRLSSLPLSRAGPFLVRKKSISSSLTQSATTVLSVSFGARGVRGKLLNC